MVTTSIGTTITQHINEMQAKFPKASGTFTRIFHELAITGKVISGYVRRAGITTGVTGKIGTINVQGEEQAKLDVISHDILINRLLATGMIAAISSEESEEIIEADEEASRNAKYVLSTDPLDGSSNIDVNVSIGTIFSLLPRVTPVGERVGKKDFLQKGTNQVAAGYILYGSSTLFVYTSGHGVFSFTLDPAIGEFILSEDHHAIPENGIIYSINEGNYPNLDDGNKRVLDYFRTTHPDSGRGYTGRYIGSLVADFHRNMLKGGIYIYPATKDGKAKLRLLYEASPLAFIVKEAGGAASDGVQDILEIQPVEVHQRVPLYIGSKREVKKALELLSSS